MPRPTDSWASSPASIGLRESDGGGAPDPARYSTSGITLPRLRDAAGEFFDRMGVLRRFPAIM